MEYASDRPPRPARSRKKTLAAAAPMRMIKMPATSTPLPTAASGHASVFALPLGGILRSVSRLQVRHWGGHTEPGWDRARRSRPRPRSNPGASQELHRRTEVRTPHGGESPRTKRRAGLRRRAPRPCWHAELSASRPPPKDRRLRSDDEQVRVRPDAFELTSGLDLRPVTTKELTRVRSHRFESTWQLPSATELGGPWISG
jgi:hypothetical protein